MYASQAPAKHLGRYKGLGWDRKYCCWRVRIFYNQKQRHVGRFSDPLTAARAYNKVATFLYGHKAILNLLPDEGDADDTFEVPHAICLAKQEAEQASSLLARSTSASTSHSSSDTCATSSVAASASASFSSAGGDSSSGSLSVGLQRLQAVLCQQQLSQELWAAGTDSGTLLPLSSCNLMDGPLLASSHAGHMLVSTAPLLDMTTGAGANLTDLSTGFLQLNLDPVAPPCALSTATLPPSMAGHMGGLLYPSTSFLQQPQQQPLHAVAPAGAYAGMGATGGVQACTPGMAMPLPPPVCVPAPYGALPMAGLAAPANTMAAGFPVYDNVSSVAVGPGGAVPAAVVGRAEPLPASCMVASNGMLVMFAPARPA